MSGIKNDQQHDLNHATYTWWLSKRPRKWSEGLHLTDPAINCKTPAEAGIAEAVAELVRARGVMVAGTRIEVNAELPSNVVAFKAPEPAGTAFFWTPELTHAQGEA